MKAEMKKKENGADELSKSTLRSKSRDCRSGPGLHAKEILTKEKGKGEGGMKMKKKNQTLREEGEEEGITDDTKKNNTTYK